jgi:transposase
LLLVSKRLEQGAFKWAPITDGVMRLSAAQLAALIEGLDWTPVHVPRVLRPQARQGREHLNEESGPSRITIAHAMWGRNYACRSCL